MTGLFIQLEKFGQKPTRGYARWGRWIWRTLIAVPVLVVLWNIGQAVWGGSRDGVILEIYNEINRPILRFSANGVAGANAFANGGGSITCCGDVSGDTAEVVWILNATRIRYNTGMRLEKRDMTLPLPKREWGEGFPYVHFMSGDKALLEWSKDSFSPYRDLHNGGYRARVRQDVRDKLYSTGKMN